MTFDFLPLKIAVALKKIDTDKIYQIRMRQDFPISIIFNTEKAYLSVSGTTKIKKDAIICSKHDIQFVINTVTENSLYAFNDKMTKGFLTTKDGLRIGIAGECVVDKSNIITIKNITSLNIRIPHNVTNCSDKVFDKIVLSCSVYNTLIISPPFCGKTTILKDLTLKLNDRLNKSILIIDERGEFENITGENIDKIKYSDKTFAFDYGVRSLAPSVVITDELSGGRDWMCMQNAVLSGVKIIASCHAESLNQVVSKNYFIKKVFERYVILENNLFGVIKEVFDGDYNRL